MQRELSAEPSKSQEVSKAQLFQAVERLRRCRNSRVTCTPIRGWRLFSHPVYVHSSLKTPRVREFNTPIHLPFGSSWCRILPSSGQYFSCTSHLTSSRRKSPSRLGLILIPFTKKKDGCSLLSLQYIYQEIRKLTLMDISSYCIAHIHTFSVIPKSFVFDLPSGQLS